MRGTCILQEKLNIKKELNIDCASVVFEILGIFL